MPYAASALAPLLLAAVLVLSSLAKLADPTSTRSVLTLLRLPRVLRQEWVARALPVGELALAAALCAPWLPLARPAAWLTFALMLTYWAVIARALTFVPRPTCGCFGRIGDQRVSARTLARNTLLVALGLVTVTLVGSGSTLPDVLARWGRGDVGWLLMTLATGALGVWVLGSAPSDDPNAPRAGAPAFDAAFDANGDDRDDGTDGDDDYVRQPIPSGVLVGLGGTPVTPLELVSERAALLILVNCTCGTTTRALRALPSWCERLPQLDVRLVTTLDPTTHERADQHLPPDALRDHGATLSDALGVVLSPAAVLLGADGLLAGGPVEGSDEVEAFVADIEAALTDPSAGPQAGADLGASAGVSDAR